MNAPSNIKSRRPMISRLAVVGCVIACAAVTLGSLPGCERPRAKAEKIVAAGSLIGVTLEEGNKIVGHEVTKHDEFNYYWDMGKGNGVIQVLVRGGKIARVEHVESFEARAARDNTPSHPGVKNETIPTIDELEKSNPPQQDGGEGGGTPPVTTGG
ncbi:MAG: hypothetical protein KIT19_07025 [Phycisphaeraceae bacterium]|nr:hypothetical protein [Phycisphaeraceae bacterium]